MSIANEQQFAMDQLGETNDGSKKKPRISYTRKFLLSFRDKDVCKKMPNLPTEFHELLESEDPSPERPRNSGDFSSHGLRRNDYSSSPPTRGIHGRWEGRWNDKDSDSQSDHSESGRRSTGLPSRRPWQAPEQQHDGLLGKGSFPKPTGFGAGGSRPQSNDTYQLRRSNEPYHPPRPYKAPPFTRREARDSFNDETFGSSDSTNEDRAEEERKRRASFELLRKEHQKEFQERQKLNPELRKNDFDFAELVGESKDRDNTPSQSNAPRPLVPPGFTNTILERKLEEKPQTETPLNSKGIINMVNGMSITNEEETLKLPSSEMVVEGEEAVRREQSVNISSFLGISKDKSFEKLPSVTLEQKKSLESSNEPSILDKLLNTAINLNTDDLPPKITQKNIEKVEETRSSPTVKSSKFAHLFLEEDNNNKPVEELHQPRGGLLSLLQVSDNNNTKASSMEFPFQGHTTSKNNNDHHQLPSKKPVTTTTTAVLTCEDLEQSILSEVVVGGETYHHPQPPQPLPQQRKASVDNQASQHLLSLLQRSGQQQDTENKPPLAEDPGKKKKSLTLENLFGSAFMNELQSIGEPVSGKAIDGGSHNQEPEVAVAFNISDKLAALNTGPMVGGQDGHFLRHHHHPQQFGNNNGYNPFDSRVKPPPQQQQLDFMDPSHHRFPPNMIHHRPPFNGVVVPEFVDHRLPPPPHIMQQQQQQQKMHHLMQQGFSGGGHHHHNQMPGGLIPELNPSSQGFPFAHRQPNYGMPPPPLPSGSQVNIVDHHPASLQTLLGIHQSRVDPSMQIPTGAMGQAGGPNRQGSMGHELDLGFGYR